jgi:hypothetical protein
MILLQIRWDRATRKFKFRKADSLRLIRSWEVVKSINLTNVNVTAKKELFKGSLVIACSDYIITPDGELRSV